MRGNVITTASAENIEHNRPATTANESPSNWHRCVSSFHHRIEKINEQSMDAVKDAVEHFNNSQT